MQIEQCENLHDESLERLPLSTFSDNLHLALANILPSQSLKQSFPSNTLQQLIRLERTPNERTRGDVEESHPFCHLGPVRKLLRRDVGVDFHVSLCRSHVLAEGDDVDINLPQLCVASEVSASTGRRGGGELLRSEEDETDLRE